jgi:hypothetical protein
MRSKFVQFAVAALLSVAASAASALAMSFTRVRICSRVRFMSHFAGTAFAFLLLATLAPSSKATPSFTYGFFVESYARGSARYPEPCWQGEEEQGTRYLEMLSITLSIDAIRDGTASFVLRTGGMQDPYAANDGVLSMGGRTAYSRGPYQWFDATDPPLDPWSKYW